MQTSTTTPFALQFTPAVPEILAELRISLMISTYQAGKVIVISSDGERLVQLPRSFDAPMGLALEDDQLAIATREEIVLLANDPRLAKSYPKQPGVYDALFVPRSTHFCGRLQVHDLAWTEKGLIGVNTVFSCLFELDAKVSFAPCWKPNFISELLPQDRCHLNGVALEDGSPVYLTALGQSDDPRGWRENKQRGGVVIEREGGEIVAAGLPMPHSPRIYDGKLFLLLSASRELVVVDVARGTCQAITRIEGFLRGMARAGDYLFIASSRSRRGGVFADIELAGAPEAFCGVTIVHLPTGARVGELRYLRSCEEIYDVQVLAEKLRPGLLGLEDSTHRLALSTPATIFWAKEDTETSREEAGS